MKKRIASMILSVCLCLTLLPTAALADNEDDEGASGARNTTWVELATTDSFSEKTGDETLTGPYYTTDSESNKTYYLPTGHYKLADSIDLDLDLGTLIITGEVTLDLNDKALYANVTVGETGTSGTLTIQDTGAYGSGTLDSTSGATLTIAAMSSVTLKSGTVTCINGDAIAISGSCALFAHGGQVKGKVTLTGEDSAISMSADAAGTLEPTVFTGDVEASGTSVIAAGTFYGKVTINSGCRVSNESKNITNNGEFVFKDGSKVCYDGCANAEEINSNDASEQLRGLKLEGTGYVQVNPATEGDDPAYYTNDGTPLTKYTDNNSVLTLGTDDLSGDGYSYTYVDGNDDDDDDDDDNGGTLTLTNALIDTIKLTKDTTVIIEIDGAAHVNDITAESESSGTITIQGKTGRNTDKLYGSGQIYFQLGGLTITNLYVEYGHASGQSRNGAFTLTDANVILTGGLNYVTSSSGGSGGSSDEKGYGLVLENSDLTVKKGYYSSVFESKRKLATDAPNELLHADKIVMEGFSTLTLDGVHIANYGTIDNGWAGLDGYIPEGYKCDYTYREGDTGSDENKPWSIYRDTSVKNDNPVTDLTLEPQPTTVKLTDYTTKVKKGGAATPPEATFTLEACDEDDQKFEEALDHDVTVSGSVTITGEDSKTVALELKGTKPAIDALFADKNGIYVRQVQAGYVSSWEIGDTVYYVTRTEILNPGLGGEEEIPEGPATQSLDDGTNVTRYYIYEADGPSDEGYYNFPNWSADLKEGSMTFTNIYTSNNNDPTPNKPSGSSSSSGSSNRPSGLNHKDHTAYVQGYQDGLVRPNNNITRAQTAVMLYRLLTSERRAEIETDVHSFTDMTAEDWYSHEVATMTNGGYINGYTDGRFGGNDPITRAQFVAILVRFLGLRDVDCTFSDVPTTHWAYDYIATAVDAGWISGYEDGTFRPDQPITRAQVVTIINRALDRGIDAGSTLVKGYQSYPDNPETAWHYYDILEATNGHTYTGSRPSENWTALK